MLIRTMMILGDFRFEVFTAAYDSLKRSRAQRWVPQARQGRSPALQYVGPGVGEITLAGTIHPLVWGGLRQIPAMRAMADRGEPLELIAGTGEVLGLWCILDVTETGTIFTSAGQPRKIDFTMKLQSYEDDVPAEAPPPATGGRRADP